MSSIISKLTSIAVNKLQNERKSPTHKNEVIETNKILPHNNRNNYVNLLTNKNMVDGNEDKANEVSNKSEDKDTSTCSKCNLIEF